MDGPALPETCPRLWLWPGHALWTGPSLGLEPHAGSVACLAAGIGGPITIRVGDRAGRPVRTALIPPRLVHRVTTDAARTAFLFLDAGSARHRAAEAAMTDAAPPLRLGHAREDALLAAEPDDPASAAAWLDLAAGPETAAPMDPRIRAATALLREPATAEWPAAAVAGEVGLSPGRFLRLFREHTGTSFRRYRLWLRMIRAARLVREHGDLTSAAAGAGFASPSHFSDTFHGMFGLRPSRLLGAEIVPVE